MFSHRIFAVIVGLGLIFWSFNLFSVAPELPPRALVKVESPADGEIQKLEEQRGAEGLDETGLVKLADLYLDKVRETADSGLYAMIEQVMSQLEALNPKNPNLYRVRASVEMGKRHFTDAISLLNTALKMEPESRLYQGMLVDAYLSVGEYKKAGDLAQKMFKAEADFDALLRISSVRELNGDIEGAKEALVRVEAKATTTSPLNRARAHVGLGMLYLRNDHKLAKNEFEKAMKLIPNFSPALRGLGRVALVDEDLMKMDAKQDQAQVFARQAEEYFKRAYVELPGFEQIVDLGDFYGTHANDALRDQYYALAEEAFQNELKNGVAIELEYALFLADRGRDVSKALSLAQTGYDKRPSVFGADVLAWAFFKNGKITEAEAMMKKALVLGEHDAQVLYHAGAIALEKNDIPKVQDFYTKSLKLNQIFSIARYKEINIKLGALFFSR